MMSARETDSDELSGGIQGEQDPFPVLLVEDNEDDVWLLQKALKKAGLALQPIVVRDGAEAIDYLAGNGIYADRGVFPFPYLILLDLNLPRRTGIEVLEWWASEPRTLHPRIIVLTWSLLRSDIDRAYQLGVVSYLLKSGDNSQLAELIKRTLQFWSLSQRPATLEPAHAASSPEARARLLRGLEIPPR